LIFFIDIENIEPVFFFLKIEESLQTNSASSSPTKVPLSTIVEEASSSETEEGSLSSNENLLGQVLLTVPHEYISITLRSNGKAELYFHAFLWQTLMLTLFKKAYPDKAVIDFDN
jgi:hypothetical protein